VVDELSNNFLHAICESARSVDPKALIVGEVWEDASSKIAYDERKEYFLGGNLDSVTNYPMKNAILNFIKYGDHQGFVNIVNLILDQYPRSVQNNLMNILDTHDTMRAITYLGAEQENIEFTAVDGKYEMNDDEKERGLRLLKLATIMQFTVMGVPTVFYGDEAGLEGMKDPYCRAPYPWGKENTDLIEWYEKLGELRNNKVLIDGDMRIKYADNSVVIYERVKDDNKVIVAINMSHENFDFVVERNMFNFLTGEYISGKITLSPSSAIILC
jgi:glycosidase